MIKVDGRTAYPIPNLPGYFMTETGHLYSKKRKNIRLLKGTVENERGYRRYHLRVNGKSAIYLGHDLVLSTFGVEKPTLRSFVVHKNGNKADDRLQNLKWYDPSSGWALEKIKPGHIYRYRILSYGTGDELWIDEEEILE